MIKVFITTNFEFDHQTFYTTNNFEFTNLILPTLKSSPNFFNKHHMQYTRRYADMWNMYTCIHEKIYRHVEYVYLYT